MKRAVIDIDGVLNYYPTTLIDFYNHELGTNYKTQSEIKNSLSFNEYVRLKKLYRQSDYKHNAPVREGAVNFLKYLHENGYMVYIVTSRDLFKYNQLERTINWFHKNGLYYDYMYRSDKKDYTIFEKFNHVDLVVEDSVDNLEKIIRINGDAKYYNVQNVENENIACPCKRVAALKEIIDDLERGE